jgi:hypothetical protein
MFTAVLRTQWKWSWAAVLGCAVTAFGIPLLSVQRAAVSPAQADFLAVSVAQRFLDVMEQWSPMYTLLAAGLGLTLAMLAWAADHRGRHVYALSLPIPRWRFVLLRFGSGAALVLVPVIALLVGSLIAASVTQIPHGLSAHPIALTVRFALAAFVAYAVFFAISAGTARTAAYVLAPLALLIAADVVLSAVNISLDLTGHVLAWAFAWPGILEVFTGRWLLIDV